MDRVLLARKTTSQDHIDIGLYALVRVGIAREFVTWIINKSSGKDDTVNGHYFSYLSLQDALDDYNKRT